MKINLSFIHFLLVFLIVIHDVLSIEEVMHYKIMFSLNPHCIHIVGV